MASSSGRKASSSGRNVAADLRTVQHPRQSPHDVAHESHNAPTGVYVDATRTGSKDVLRYHDRCCPIMLHAPVALRTCKR